jgi:LDH2 family malate/lactate/ureidoglycolate dehydrogenase
MHFVTQIQSQLHISPCDTCTTTITLLPQALGDGTEVSKQNKAKENETKKKTKSTKGKRIGHKEERKRKITKRQGKHGCTPVRVTRNRVNPRKGQRHHWNEHDRDLKI